MDGDETRGSCSFEAWDGTIFVHEISLADVRAVHDLAAIVHAVLDRCAPAADGHTTWHHGLIRDPGLAVAYKTTVVGLDARVTGALGDRILDATPLLEVPDEALRAADPVHLTLIGVVPVGPRPGTDLADLRHPSPPRRIAALQGCTVAPPFLSALSDPSSDVRRFAAAALGGQLPGVGPEVPVETLAAELRTAVTDTPLDPVVATRNRRHALLWALGLRGHSNRSVSGRPAACRAAAAADVTGTPGAGVGALAEATVADLCAYALHREALLDGDDPLYWLGGMARRIQGG